MTITTRLRALGLAAALLGAGLSGRALAAQGSELNSEPTAVAASRGPTVGPLAVPARPAADRLAAQALSVQNFLERSGATGGGGQYG